MTTRYPLPRAEGTLYSELGIGPEATPAEVTDAKQEHVRRIKAAIAKAKSRLDGVAQRSAQPQRTDEQKTLQERVDALEKELSAFSDAVSKIEKSRNRAEYDLSHPPCGLLKIEETKSPFADRRLAMTLLRRDLSNYLEARGEAVFHPTDLTREDFVGDFTPNAILDGGRDT